MLRPQALLEMQAYNMYELAIMINEKFTVLMSYAPKDALLPGARVFATSDGSVL